ncbi:TIGR03503 family protein [Glaciecola sp. MH2013]|nr:TIGR03503 family protein [Glaciecola sp. MH2013]
MFSFFSLPLHAQEERTPDLDSLLQRPVVDESEVKQPTVPIIELGNEFQNSIEFLDNRFRIDNDVEEVTMIFFREAGSSPIVLVRPDGSKVFLEDDDRNDMLRWYETETYDMISLKKPMPGPWQAVGQILPGSRVMIIADITLNAEPIPTNIYSGEIIKQTAVLENNGEKVDFSPFRDVVTLSIDFVSNNNPNFENFGLGSRSIARFQDNGEGLDEVAADGIFTGQFNLGIPSGEWRPTFSIRTPMYNREQVNETVILHPNPIKLELQVDETNEAAHRLFVSVDTQHIKLDSLLLDGRIRRPNGESQKIALTETNPNIKEIEIPNDSFGKYRIKLTAFAETVDNRDVIIDVPEYTFATKAPEVVELVSEEGLERTEPLDVSEFIQPSEPGWSEADTITIVISINLFIVLFGSIGLFLIINKRNNPDDYIMQRMQQAALGSFGKIKTIVSKKLTKVKSEDSEEGDESQINKETKSGS